VMDRSTWLVCRSYDCSVLGPVPQITQKPKNEEMFSFALRDLRTAHAQIVIIPVGFCCVVSSDNTVTC
jgi:hypothetical protein